MEVMEKMSVLNQYQKAVDTLKTTECSAKDKLIYFTQIADTLLSPSLHTNANYFQLVSNGISILLLFCEETDSTVRMSAEENLNKIIRFCENGNIVKVQLDLYHEIKKNGHERSLRICLNIFSHYMHLIRQRKARSYAHNLLPCVYAIIKRKETLVLETLTEFMKNFSKYLQISLNDNEVANLVERFIEDITAECAVKRRCAAANAIAVIEYSRKQYSLGRNALAQALEILIRDQKTNAIVGVLGFLRLLLPILLKSNDCNHSQMIEVFEVCLQYLFDKNHSIINASLEVMIGMLLSAPTQFRDILHDKMLCHQAILFKRKSLKNQIFKMSLLESRPTSSRKSSGETIRHEPLSDSMPSFNLTNSLCGDHNLLQVSTPVRSFDNASTDERAILNSSDFEMESLKSIDFESEIALSQSVTTIEEKPKKLKSQKSTESIGSFFNSLLAHSNKETVSKFFTSSQKAMDSPQGTPKSLSTKTIRIPNRRSEDDTISLDSTMSAQLSMSSSSVPETMTHNTSVSPNLSMPTIDIDDLNETTQMFELKETEQHTTTTTYAYEHQQTTDEHTNTFEESNNIDEVQTKALHIGTIFDQTIMSFTVRLVCSKFLLSEIDPKLISDQIVRVSIKNLSLALIANCVLISPETLLLTIEKDDIVDNIAGAGGSSVDAKILQIDEIQIRKTCTNINDKLPPIEKSTEHDSIQLENSFLEIKDDHFGESPTSYFHFIGPLSKSDGFTLLHLDDDSKSRAVESNVKLSGELGLLLGDRKKKDTLIAERMVKSMFDRVHHVATNSIGVLQKCGGQRVYDILYYYDHADPILRANTVQVIGNFMKTVLHQTACHYDRFFNETDTVACEFLRIDKLIRLVLSAMHDENHAVVKQALITFENCIEYLANQQPLDFVADTNFDCAIMSNGAAGAARNLLDNFDKRKLVCVYKMVECLLLVFKNKYWLIQCKYMDVLVNLDIDRILSTIDQYKRQHIQEKILTQLFHLLKDTDCRVRNHAAIALRNYVQHTQIEIEHADRNDEQLLIKRFISDSIFKHLPSTLAHLGRQPPLFHAGFQRMFCRVVYTLSNMLLDISNKNQQFGILNAIKELLAEFDPINYYQLWQEYNILAVCIAYLMQNPILALDLSGQSDLIEICTQLLCAHFSSENSPNDDWLNTLLMHNMKILNIFTHLFTNAKPLIIPKSQKGDLFLSGKELTQLNSNGYFGDSLFYIKLYTILKSSFKSYKITINKDSGAKLFQLLNTTFRSLAALLELKRIDSMFADTIKLIRECLTYANTLINYQPESCIVCMKQLLKYLFGKNYQQQKSQIERYANIECWTPDENNTRLLETVRKFYVYKAGEHSLTEIDGHIKLFEPIVIASLKLFTKSNSQLQSVILAMLCQLLEFKVNYCLLDSNNTLIDFVQNHLEMIESGYVRKPHILMPQIIRFLFYLAKQRDKKLTTIPKIINIVDNLLANNYIRACSIDSLAEFTYELFFNADDTSTSTTTTTTTTTTAVDTESITKKELHTQKEVVFSMITKFLIEPKMQEIASLVIFSKTFDDATAEAEILSTLTQLMRDNLLVVQSEQDFNRLSTLFRVLRKSTLLESKNFGQTLDVFFEIIDSALMNNQTLSLVIVLLENVFLNTEEIYLLSHVKLYLNRQLQLGQNETDDEIDFFTRKLCQSIVRCLFESGHHTVGDKFGAFVISKYLLSVVGLLKFHRVASALAPLVQTELDKIKSLKNIIITRTDCRCQRAVVTFLAALHFPRRQLFANFVHWSTTRSECLFKSKIIQHFCDSTTDVTKWHEDDIILLLDSEFDNLTTYANDFLVALASSELYGDNVLDRLIASTTRTISTNEVHGLQILHKANVLYSCKCLHIMASRYLFTLNRAIGRRAATICLDKLATLREAADGNLANILSYEDYEKLLDTLGRGRCATLHPALYECFKELRNLYCPPQLPDAAPDEQNSAISTLAVDEGWFIEQVKYLASHRNPNADVLAEIIMEVKSESKLAHIMLGADSFDLQKLPHTLAHSFAAMIRTFKLDCMQFNAHINYLKMPPLLKTSIICLIKFLKQHNEQAQATQATQTAQANATTTETHRLHQFEHLVSSVLVFMQHIDRLERACLVHVDAKLFEKYLTDNIFKSTHHHHFLEFAMFCVTYAKGCCASRTQSVRSAAPFPKTSVEQALRCCDLILKNRFLWAEANRPGQVLSMQK